MQKVFTVAVDIGRKLPAPAFEVNTNDLKSVKLLITITNGQTLLDLTDTTVRIAIRKPDNNIVFQDCTVKDAASGQVEIVLENQAYIMAGTHTAEIMCYMGSEVVAVSGTFSYKSTKGIMNNEAVESRSEFTTITGMLKGVQDTIEELAKMEMVQSTLPQLFFTGDMNGISKDDSVNLKMSYKSKDKSFDGFAKMNWQGSSSLIWDKKNYTIKLYNDSNYSNKLNVDFKNWGKFNKFVLKANFIDFTHARNIVNANLWKEIVTSRNSIPNEVKIAPNMGEIDGFPVEVYINGIYAGLYTFNIPKDTWTFGMDAKNNKHAAIIGEDNYPAGVVFRGEAIIDGTDWKLESPDNLHPDIKTSFNNMVSFVRETENDTTFREGIKNFLDIDLAIDYYLFAYISANVDGLAKNMFMLTYDGVRWIPYCYDLDCTWGKFWDGSFKPYDVLCPYEYQASNSLLWTRIQRAYRNELIERYWKLRESVLSEQHIIALFERFVEQIDPSRYENDLIANISIPNPQESNIRQLRLFILNRLGFTDRFFTSLAEADFSDDFNRADSDNLGTSWIEPLNEDISIGIRNNKATTVNGGWCIAYKDVKSKNFIVEAEVTFGDILPTSNSAGMGLLIRGDSSDNRIILITQGSSTVAFSKKTSAGEEGLGYLTIPGGLKSSRTYHMRIICHNNKICATFDYNPVFIGIIDDLQNNTTCGLCSFGGFSDSTPTMDNFQVEVF